MLHHSPTKPSMRQGQRNVLISELHQPSGPNMSWYGICPHLMVTLFSSCTAQAEGNKNVRAFNIRSRISSGSFSSRTHRGRVTHVKRSALLDGRRAERRARRCQHMPVLGFWGAVAHGYVRIADSCRKGGKFAGVHHPWHNTCTSAVRPFRIFGPALIALVCPHADAGSLPFSGAVGSPVSGRTVAGASVIVAVPHTAAVLGAVFIAPGERQGGDRHLWI